MLLSSQNRFLDGLDSILSKKIKTFKTTTDASYITGASITVKTGLDLSEIQHLITLSVVWNFKNIAITPVRDNLKVTFSQHEPQEAFPSEN